MFAYAWDFEEVGVAKTLSQLKEIGINTVTLAASYHAGKFLRPKAKVGKIYFPEDGTTYFKTNLERYGKIKPVSNSAYGDGNVLSMLTKDSDIAVNAWLVLLHNSRLGSANLGSTVKNAFGDSYIYALCPSAPAARAYAVGLAHDVSESYEIDGISIESFGFPPFEHGFHHEMSFVKPNFWLSSYLGLCFCEFCVSGAEGAGVDAKRLKAKVAQSINDYLSGDIDFPDDMAKQFWLADVVGDRELQKYLNYRCTVVTSLLQEIKTAVRKDVVVAVIPSVARPTAGAWYEGTDLLAVADTIGVIEAAFYENSSERIQTDLVDIKRRMGGVGKIKGILRPAFPDLESGEAVMSAVHALVNGGVHDIGFYNYGHIRSQSLVWIADALASVKGGSS